MSKAIKLKDIVNQFELDVISGKENLDNEIKVYGLNRAGLELTGFFEEGNNGHRLILMSSKEFSYMSKFEYAERKEKYRALIKWDIPGIIITKKFNDEALIDVAKELNFPVVKTRVPSTSEFSREIYEYLDEYFAPSEEVHGSLVNIYGKGVLIKGASGIGKSEVTLDLLKQNHMFIGDDRIVLKRKANKVFGKSHPILSHMVEVRGIGIINIAETLGLQIIMEETSVDIIIELSVFQNGDIDNYERIGRSFEKSDILGHKIPYLKIPVSSGRNVANIIETAVSQLKLQETGKYKKPVDVLNKRVRDFNEENN